MIEGHLILMGSSSFRLTGAGIVFIGVVCQGQGSFSRKASFVFPFFSKFYFTFFFN